MNDDVQSARKIYVDANVIIYFLEGEPATQEKAATLFEFADANAIPMMTSEITIAECLYGAHKRGSEALAEEYRRIFHDIEAFQLVPVEQEILERAAKIGAEQSLKLIDAIHVTSALEVGCDVFVTNDRGIRSMDGLRVVRLLEA